MKQPSMMPEWLERQINNVEKTVDNWSNAKRKASGIKSHRLTNDNLEDLNHRLALKNSQSRAAELVKVLDQVEDLQLAGKLLLTWFNSCDAIGEHSNALRKHFERCGFLSDSNSKLEYPLVVYRATWEDNDPEAGLSWTTDYAIATRFGRSFLGARARLVLKTYREGVDVVIWRGVCHRALAYLTSRNEYEVIPAELVNIHEYARLCT